MTLLEEAKTLGIRGAHLMKEETLEKKIEAAKEDKSFSTSEKPVESQSLLKEARALRGKLWDKTKDFLKFVEEHKSQLPEEYERVKKYIK